MIAARLVATPGHKIRTFYLSYHFISQFFFSFSCTILLDSLDVLTLDINTPEIFMV